MTDASSAFFGVEIAGKLYRADDLELAEIEEMEDEFGRSFPEIPWESAKAIRRLVFYLRRKHEPDLTLETCRIRLADLIRQPEPDAPPPVAGEEQPAADDSTPVDTGAQQ